jgi:dTDP-4-amino-4,6-dideoxygalactose transaminase
MKKALFLSVMLAGVAALGFSQAALSGTYRYSANACVAFTDSNFEGRWNAQTPFSGTYTVSGSRLTLNITGGPRAPNTWVWTIVDANTLRDQDGVQTSIHYPAIRLFTAYRNMVNQTPKAEYVSAHELTLPLYPTMTHEEVDIVCDALKCIP